MESFSKNIEEYFLGILYTSNYKEMDIEKKKDILIEKKIYVLDEDISWGTIENENYKNLPEVPVFAEEVVFGESFNYLDSKYKINDLFLKEFFTYIQDDVFANAKQPLEIRIKEINLHAKHLANFSDVNEFYKTQYSEHYDKIKENQYFLIYNEPELWHYPDWEYFVTSDISSNAFLIETHLFSEYGYCSFEEISKEWEELYFYSEIMSFLEEKMNGSDTTSLSKLIFVDNGEDIFNFIVLKCQEGKIEAFYNYLYYFLKDILKKIKLEDEDSNTYKKYVIKKKYLKKYGRMQRARSNNKKRHNQMMSLFKNLYSQEFEKTLSKDE